MKNKIIIFKSKTEHFWHSCRIIEEHILNAFQKSEILFEIYECQNSLTTEQLKTLANTSFDLHFYFLSDFLKQQDLCSEIISAGIKGKFYIPIYGNMTVEIYRWLSLGKTLKGQKVFLLGASHRSCRQIKQFVDADVVEIPFCFETMLEKVERDKDSIDLVYAGRITPQKNILEMLETFHEAHQFNSKLHLHVAGQFHDRKFHLHGYSLDLDKYNERIRSLLNHPAITFHQNLNQDELLNLYQQCDYFISMSTYHDEDFGMSACQAAVMNLGLILSDWGGQAAFKDHSFFVPVSVNTLSLPVINKMSLLKILSGLKVKRQQTRYREHFSYQSFINNLQTLINKNPSPFEGLTRLYEDYAGLGLKTFPFDNLEQSPTKKDFYLAIYQSYLSDT